MKRWTIKKHDHEQVRKLAAALEISPIVAALLTARGFDTEESAHKFLNPSYDDLHEPFLMKGMREAVVRILQAIENKEKILIWGRLRR
jgi:single-stranded-DNA-specific exonuclease